MTVLAARHADGDDRQDLIANCIFFILAGHHTTTTLLTLGAHLLCTHLDAQAALQRDPGRWPAAVEEMLRLITPTTFTGVTPRPMLTFRALPARPGSRACCSWPPRTVTLLPFLIPIDSISAVIPTLT